MEKLNGAFIHGFCGLPQDGDALFNALKNHNDVNWQTPNLWRDLPPSRYSNLAEAGQRLSEVLRGDRLQIFAYSLGGRIALHWPESQWHRIEHLILMSVHGGLESLTERHVRLENDQKWAQRFLHESWDSLCQSWNQQDVFSEDRWRPVRNEKDFSRDELACALTNWSLASQENRLEVMQKFPFPVTYFTGERDRKFSTYAQSLKPHLASWKFCEIAGHGHSLYGSAPEAILRDL